jgi:hypothetical protein
MLPRSSVDLAFFCDTTHHIGQRVDFYRKLSPAIKPGGKRSSTPGPDCIFQFADRLIFGNQLFIFVRMTHVASSYSHSLWESSPIGTLPRTEMFPVRPDARRLCVKSFECASREDWGRDLQRETACGR